MLTKFEIILKNENDLINCSMGSLFHGALMELLPYDYAEKLHINSLKPFSQYIQPYSKEIRWNIQTLNEECACYIRNAVMSGIDKLKIKNKDKIFEIVSRSESNITYKQFIENTYFGKTFDLITIYFNSPASFKIDGKYINYPNLSLIYKNLIHKFDTFSNEFSLYDEDMIETLVNNSYVTSYKLKSTYYGVESVSIPSYVGQMTVKINKSAQIANIAKLLLTYGQYSGVGIKTALGMGAVKVEEVRKIGKR